MDDLFTNYFSQTKQRIDIDFDMNNCILKCLTKLTFILNKNFDNNNNKINSLNKLNENLIIENNKINNLNKENNIEKDNNNLIKKIFKKIFT